MALHDRHLTATLKMQRSCERGWAEIMTSAPGFSVTRKLSDPDLWVASWPEGGASGYGGDVRSALVSLVRHTWGCDEDVAVSLADGLIKLREADAAWVLHFARSALSSPPVGQLGIGDSLGTSEGRDLLRRLRAARRRVDVIIERASKMVRNN